MSSAGIGTVRAGLQVDTRSGDAALQGTSEMFKAAGVAAELAGEKIAASGEKIDRSAQIQERAVERARRAWEREVLQQERAAQAEAETARAMEMAALKADILARAEQAEAQKAAAAAVAQRELAEATKKRAELQATLAEGLAFAGVTVGLTAFAEGAREMISSTMEMGVELGHLAQQTGISAENLSILKYAASTTGVEFESLVKGFKRLSTEVYEADNGSKTAQKSFTALGVSAVDLRAKGNDLYGVLGLVANRFKELPDGIEKNALATQLFGRAGQSLIPILNQGADAIERMKASAPIFTDRDIESMEQLHRSTVNLNTAFRNVAISVTTAFGPAAEGYLNNFAAGIDAISDSAKGALDWLHRLHLSEPAGKGTGWVLDVLPPASPGHSLARQPVAVPRLSSGSDDDGASGASTRPKRASADRSAFTVNPWELANQQVYQDTANADANAEFYKKLDTNAEQGLKDWRAFIDANEAATQAQMLDAFKTRAPNVSLPEPTVTAMDKLRDSARELALSFTDLPAHVTALFDQTLNDLNSKLVDALSGKKGVNFAEVGTSLMKGTEKMGLEYVEGSLMKMVLGKNPNAKLGSRDNPMWTKSADGAGAGAGSQGLLSGIFGKIFGGGSGGDVGSSGASGLGSAMGSIGGSLLTALPGFASGGSIPSNMPSIVGERGPEIFMPRSAGRIIPNDQAFGGGHTFNVSVDARGATDPAETEATVHRAMRGYMARVPSMAVSAVADYNSRRPKSMRI